MGQNDPPPLPGGVEGLPPRHCLVDRPSVTFFLVIEAVCATQYLALTVAGLTSDPERYAEEFPQAARVAPFFTLLPALIFEVFWLTSAVLAIGTLRFLRLVYLQLPNVVFSCVAVVVQAVLAANAVRLFITVGQRQVNSSTAVYCLVAVFVPIFVVVHLIGICAKALFFRLLLRKQNTVTSSDKSQISEKSNSPEIDAEAEGDDTYSTKSTVIVTDD